ncbi:MAG: amidohydrolase family protein [Candidatus Hodarchaeales archaeon]
MIINTWIVSFEKCTLKIIENGCISVEGDSISYIGSMKGYNYQSADQIIDGTNHVTIPGLINAHIHTAGTILRGCAQDVPEIEWMNKTIGPFMKYMTTPDIIAGSKLGVLEGLKTGTTTFSEYTRNVDTLIEQVYLPFSARVVATETINEVSDNRINLKPTDLYEFDRNKGEKALKDNENLIKKYKDNPLVECMYGPQALDMISTDLLQTISECAKDTEHNIHMHVAQGGRERIQIQGRYGESATTVKVLDKYHILNDNLVSVHCHDTTENERKLMVKKGVKMVACPSSIAMIDGIVPPIAHYSSLSGIIGLGTDQAPGPGHHNMFREIRTAGLLAKIQLNDPTVLPAWKVLQFATNEGSKVLGLTNKIGSIEVGKKADLITINLNHTSISPLIVKPLRNIIPNLVYSTTGLEIDNVIINGKPIMINNNFLYIDENRIIKEANKSAKKVSEIASEEWLEAGSQLAKNSQKGLL